MDWGMIIDEIGGGLSAIVIVGLAFWGFAREKRVNYLTDKFIEQNGDNIAAMKDLTSAVRDQQRGNR